MNLRDCWASLQFMRFIWPLIAVLGVAACASANSGEHTCLNKVRSGNALTISGEDFSYTVMKAYVSEDPVTRRPELKIAFDAQGTFRFYWLTVEHQGEEIPVQINGKTLFSPLIEERVPGGLWVVSGNYTPDELEEAAKLLAPVCPDS